MTTTNKVIGIDLLTILCRGQLPHFAENDGNKYRKLTENLYIKKSERGDMNYSQTAELIYMGEPVAYVTYAPKRQANDPELVNVRMYNNLCYQNGFTDLLKDVMIEAKLNFKALKNVDVFIDYALKQKDRKKSFIYGVAKGIATNEIMNQGKARFHPYYASNNDIEGFHFGSRKSDKFCRAYYKDKEITDSSKKEYIRDFWTRSGMKTPYGVERIEMSLKKGEIEKYDTITFESLHLLEDKEFLSSLFRSSQKGYFEFVEVEELKSKKRVDRCKKVFALSYYNLGGKLLDKVKAVLSDKIWSLKNSAKMLFLSSANIERKGGDGSNYLAIAREISENIGLSRWFDINCARWRQEFDGWINNQHSNYITKYESIGLGQLQLVKVNSYI